MKTRLGMTVCFLAIDFDQDSKMTDVFTASAFDHARDLLHLINVQRDEMPRPIVGVAHSMGGTHLFVFVSYHLLDHITGLIFNETEWHSRSCTPDSSTAWSFLTRSSKANRRKDRRPQTTAGSL
jgi:hypothetical protein